MLVVTRVFVFDLKTAAKKSVLQLAPYVGLLYKLVCLYLYRLYLYRANFMILLKRRGTGGKKKWFLPIEDKLNSRLSSCDGLNHLFLIMRR